jgi:hypothetical protein
MDFEGAELGARSRARVEKTGVSELAAMILPIVPFAVIFPCKCLRTVGTCDVRRRDRVGDSAHGG